ncbi:MAG: hypothetical protein WC651_05440 [Candidatus Gracilibacteria bacterium]|jgi:hypothetical protein
MTSKAKIIKQALIVIGLMTGAILLVQFIPGALANGFISGQDNPAIIGGATGGTGDLRELALRIVNYFLGFLGLLAVLMVIYGGVLYITAAGNEENAKKGKTIIMYAAVGIIIVLLSFAIINTILGAATSTVSGGGAIQ